MAFLAKPINHPAAPVPRYGSSQPPARFDSRRGDPDTPLPARTSVKKMSHPFSVPATSLRHFSS